MPHNELQVSESSKIYDKYSDEIIRRINEFKSKPTVDNERKGDIKESGESNYVYTRYNM